MNLIKKIINFFLNLSNIQKIFLLVFLFNILTEGEWVYLFTESRVTVHILHEAVYAISILGFFLFWKKKN